MLFVRSELVNVAQERPTAILTAWSSLLAGRIFVPSSMLGILLVFMGF
jgi:hypothetical protein